MNRRTLMIVLGGASLMTAIPALGQTQVADADRTAVQAWLDECAAAWATGDAERMFHTAADDVEWVNIVGMHWQGKAQAELAHRVYLETMFRGVPLTLEEVESIVPLGADALIVVARWNIGAFTPPDGQAVPPSKDRMSLVLQRTSAGLRIAHGANVQINQAVQQFDPAKGKPPA